LIHHKLSLFQPNSSGACTWVIAPGNTFQQNNSGAYTNQPQTQKHKVSHKNTSQSPKRILLVFFHT
ncbi:hypothetical protein, partial [Lentilactobacillus sunkii]|uniref:hypothetical protein n=1 Tax=Lentilactobacillus sunkii TaxID=481719 RepID=UPI001F3DB2D0